MGTALERLHWNTLVQGGWYPYQGKRTDVQIARAMGLTPNKSRVDFVGSYGDYWVVAESKSTVENLNRDISRAVNRQFPSSLNALIETELEEGRGIKTKNIGLILGVTQAAMDRLKKPHGTGAGWRVVPDWDGYKLQQYIGFDDDGRFVNYWRDATVRADVDGTRLPVHVAGL